jgi:hypothetical protein
LDAGASIASNTDGGLSADGDGGDSGVSSGSGADGVEAVKLVDAAESASRRADADTDGGATACRLVRGPIALPLRGPATLVARGEMIDALQDDDGHPHSLAFSAPPVPAAAAPLAEGLEAGTNKGTSLACAIAGEKVFCPDGAGDLHRTTVAGDSDRVVANIRPGSRVGAAVLAGTHTLYAYLASRRTSEGWVSEAWLGIDEAAPVKLSEDGAGATSLALAARGSAVLALTVDARTALTAMHVRELRYEGGLRLGEDAVVFVGGPGDRRTAGALLVPASGPAWALLPIGKDVATFGLALVRLEDPPRVDEPTFWSMYPNGLDPAPVATALGSAARWVARVRPQAAEPGAVRVLEVGELRDDGVFTARGVIRATGNPTFASVAIDARGALWVAWVDGAGSWVERMACK